MQKFVTNYGVNAMRSFLALAQTKEVTGDQIIAFGISVEPEVATKVFTGYCDLLDQISDIDSFLNEEFAGDTETKEQLAILAKNRLEKHAATFLANHLQRTDAITDAESAELLVEVEKAAGLASAISVALRSRKVTSVDTFQSFRQDVLSGREVYNSPLVEEMLEIYRQNYIKKNFSEMGRAGLLDNFTAKLQKDTTLVYVWRIGESDVLTFLYADEYRDESKVYIGGLNNNPTFNDTKAGKGLIEQMLRDYDQQKYTITADAAPGNAEAYIKLFDFVAYKRNDDPDGDVPFVLDLARQVGWSFASKATSRNEVLKQLQDTDTYVSADKSVVYIKADSSVGVLDTFLDASYVVTKMFSDQKAGINYFVLEYAPWVHEVLSPTNLETLNAA